MLSHILVPCQFHAPAQYVDVMFVDSCDASEGLLDSRLAADLAGISRLEELEVGAVVRV